MCWRRFCAAMKSIVHYTGLSYSIYMYAPFLSVVGYNISQKSTSLLLSLSIIYFASHGVSLRIRERLILPLSIPVSRTGEPDSREPLDILKLNTFEPRICRRRKMLNNHITKSEGLAVISKLMTRRPIHTHLLLFIQFIKSSINHN